MTTFDHLLFNECIDVFRKNGEREPFEDHDSKDIYSVILSPFKISKEWDLKYCVIYPTIEVELGESYVAFVSIVKICEKICRYSESHLYTNALCSILSTIAGAPFKSPRNKFYLRELPEVSDKLLIYFAMTHPLYSHVDVITEEEENSLIEQCENVLKKLYQIEYKNYLMIIQSFRMIQLSHINRREDFGLGYLLMISAIETIAQNAIMKSKKKWEDNFYLSQRYVTFILKYAPVSEWKTYVKNPRQVIIDAISFQLDHMKNNNPSFTQVDVEDRFSGADPEKLNNNEIETILKNSYDHRSEFVHQGKQPPHQSSVGHQIFFQEYYKHNVAEIETILLPRFELLSALAKNSIINYMSQLK